jgi:ABC-2 type transport system ATP-binding protein
MNVIMAMIHDPEILVFDEPEAGLDPQSRIVVREFIRETARSKTVILTTHNMDEAQRIADRVAIIDNGRLLRLDTPDNLKRSIGKGDILEIALDQRDPDSMDRVLKLLQERGFSLEKGPDRWSIRAMNLIPRIHEVHRVMEDSGMVIREMKVRENTLEDVFIHLTGKSLRS